MEILESNEMTRRLGEVALSRFVVEFRDPSKATSSYLSSINEKKSMKKVSAQEREATMNCDASNSVSESSHALVKTMQKLCGPTARADGLGAVGQSQGNNDFGHGDQAKVTGRHPKEGNKVTHEIGEFHKLVPKLTISLVQTQKIVSSKWKKTYDVALERKRAAARRRRDIIFEKKLEVAEEDYIVPFISTSNITLSAVGAPP